jgi:hypothetical protein
MYQERMLSYYPNVIKSISEFQAIIDGEHPEFEQISLGNEYIIADAYLLTMSEPRIKQWEKILGIPVREGSTLEDRRETVLARIRGQGKLNTKLINTIVKTFTNADCKCWFENSTLYVRLNPSPDGKTYLMDNLIQEIAKKIPAHLNYNIKESWQYWREVNSNYDSWLDVQKAYGTWENVLHDNPGQINALDESKLDEFYLG